jgi:predicted nucleic acid-binding protein
MKYIDSSVFRGAFLPTDPNHKVSRGVVASIIRDRAPAAISIFGLAEIGGFFTRNISEKVGLKHVTTLQRMENLQMYYAEDFETFMNSVLAVSVSTGLPGADAIHFVSAISLPEVDEIITLDRHFKRVKDQIKVTILSAGGR